MACFTDYITVAGTCSDNTPSSGYSLKDIGITISELNALVTADYSDGETLGEEKIAFAIKQVENKIYNHFASKFRSRSILDGQRLGFAQTNMQSVAAVAGYMKGIEIDLCNNDSFVDIFVSSISLFTDFTGNIDVKVYDLYQNKLLDTLTIAGVAGQVVTSYVGKTYASERGEMNLIFVYDTTGINSYKTVIKQGGCSDCASGQASWVNGYFKARGIKIDANATKVKQNLSGLAETGGMSIQYNVNCNYRSWICTLRETLALPILYLAGENIMEFGLHNSDRLNSRTILDGEKMESRRTFYRDKYVESIENILKNIALPSDSKCFDCRDKNMFVTMLP